MAKDGEDWHRKQQENRTILVQFSKVNTQKLNVTNSHKSHTHNFSMHSGKVLSLEISAWKNLHGGQFTSSTQLIKPNYLVTL